ncbi:MAG: response regulator, partial [Burkholderiales bacterium]|nr:response regulator [Burkholderiales bacterium]
MAVLNELTGVKVLVVDDDRNARQSLSDVLALFGAEVKEASSGDEGLKVWQAWRPSVLISDIGMPRMDGYQFIRALRIIEHKENRPRTPALAFSAYPPDQVRRLAKEAGFDLHVGK